MIRAPPISTLFPDTTLFRFVEDFPFLDPPDRRQVRDAATLLQELGAFGADRRITPLGRRLAGLPVDPRMGRMVLAADEDRKSTRLNSSHANISYAVFCLKKK